jgi:hypothetical protein
MHFDVGGSRNIFLYFLTERDWQNRQPLCFVIQKIPHKKQEELAILKMPLQFFSGFFPF